MDGNYCSSSECSSFSSFLSLVPSTSALTLPTITPLVGSGTSAVIFDFCFSVSYTCDVLSPEEIQLLQYCHIEITSRVEITVP